MALETLTGSAVFIDALVPTNPAGTDGKNEGDDHLRGVKQVIHNTFPNVGASVNASAGELNILVGASVSAGELNVLSATPAISNQALYMHSNQAVLQGVAVGAALSFDASAGIVNLDISSVSAIASLNNSDEFVLLDASDSTLKRVSNKTLADGRTWKYISTVSANGGTANLVFSNFYDDTSYQQYRFFVEGLQPSAGDVNFYLEFETSAGGYASGVQNETTYHYWHSATMTMRDAIIDLARLVYLGFNVGNSGGQCLAGEFDITNYKPNSSAVVQMHASMQGVTSANHVYPYYAVGQNTTFGVAGCPGVRITPSSGGNIKSGKIFQYGLKRT